MGYIQSFCSTDMTDAGISSARLFNRQYIAKSPSVKTRINVPSDDDWAFLLCGTRIWNDCKSISIGEIEYPDFLPESLVHPV